ncbi:MAG: hypothetical protein ACYTGS_09345, partial [Planctomycetota bacterium]
CEPRITNCTINGNTAGWSGIVSMYHAHIHILNSIIRDNAEPAIDTAFGSKSAGFATVYYSVLQSDWPYGGHNIVADPCFASPGYWDPNGTPADTSDDFWIEGDYHLLPSSLCINAGDPNYIPEPNETDLDGDLRVTYGRVDIGADEYSNGCFPPDHPDYAQWLAVGEPECWCNPRQCHGDSDGQLGGNPKTGYYAVGPGDLNILIAGWLVIEPPHGLGIATIPNGICADFAHDLGGGCKCPIYRVGPTDLNILISNWMVKEPPFGPGVPTDCLD